MGQNLDTIQQAYKRYGEGDVDGASEAWSDDIHWEGPGLEEAPGGGTHEGKDAVKEALGTGANVWITFDVEPDEWIEDGETVIVLGQIRAIPGMRRAPITVPFVHIWRFEGGKANRVQLLTDTLALASHARLVERTNL
jgi:ketosteroid isomerase-like protein